MRRQYHLRPSDGGFDAWDVHRLVEESRGLPVTEVSLDSLDEIDSAYWYQTDRPTVRSIVEHMRLIDEVDPAHPIVLSHDGRVMDGMHRVARALLEGKATVAAVRFEETPEPDYRDCDPDDLPYD